MSDKEKIERAIKRLENALATNYELAGTWRTFCYGLLEDLQTGKEAPAERLNDAYNATATDSAWKKRKRMVNAYGDLERFIMVNDHMNNDFLLALNTYITAKVLYMLALKDADKELS
jgi:hypothetical protein